MDVHKWHSVVRHVHVCMCVPHVLLHVTCYSCCGQYYTCRYSVIVSLKPVAIVLLICTSGVRYPYQHFLFILCSDSREGPTDPGSLPPGWLSDTELPENSGSRHCSLGEDTFQEARLWNGVWCNLLQQHWSLWGSNLRHSTSFLGADRCQSRCA